MIKRALTAAGIFLACLVIQTPAQADGKFSFSFSTGHGFKSGFHSRYKGHRGFRTHHYHRGHRGYQKKKFVSKFHRPVFSKHVIVTRKPHYVAGKKVSKKRSEKYRSLSNRQLSGRLRHRGLYNVSVISRGEGVAHIIAHNTRGYIGKYMVNTHNGSILKGEVVRYL